MYIEQLREVFPSPSQYTVAVCNQINLLIPYYMSGRLVTLLKIIDAPLKASDIFDHTVRFKIINFSFQIFLLFVPEMCTMSLYMSSLVLCAA